MGRTCAGSGAVLAVLVVLAVLGVSSPTVGAAEATWDTANSIPRDSKASAGGTGSSSGGASGGPGPHFDPQPGSGNVSALLGKTAYLTCRVNNLGNKTVSWVRHRDVHLLTVGLYTYTSDERFRAVHEAHSDDWTLQIKYPQHRDAGVYECQISTTPHLSHFVHFTVVEPTTEVLGGPELYIGRGSTINLTCVIQGGPTPPEFVFWYHNEVIINAGSSRGGVQVATDVGPRTRSSLLLKNARSADSGQYQCKPTNAETKNITVHVLNGEHPEAMQHGDAAQIPFIHPRHLLMLVAISLWAPQYLFYSS